MNLTDLTTGLKLSGSLGDRVQAFLRHHDCPKTALHCADVAAKAHELALQCGADAQAAEAGGWIHDASAIFPAAERVQVAQQLGVDVLPEEAAFPMIIHQKLSVVLGREIFGVTDEAVLSAVGCHTTLKRDASLLDKVVFVADKIAWDQPGAPPYLDDMNAALNQSLDHAALVYLRYLWQRRNQLKVLHPWTHDAYHQLSGHLDSD